MTDTTQLFISAMTEVAQLFFYCEKDLNKIENKQIEKYKIMKGCAK